MAAAPSMVEEGDHGDRKVDWLRCAKISSAGKTGVDEASKTQCKN